MSSLAHWCWSWEPSAVCRDHGGLRGLAAASIVVGLIVWGLVTSLGGPTVPGLNPTGDLVPRFLHWILPVPNKGDSRWGEAWIPVVAPIIGAIVGAMIFKSLFAA